MIWEIIAVICGLTGLVFIVISLYVLAGWPGTGLFIGAVLLISAVLLGSRPDKPV